MPRVKPIKSRTWMYIDKEGEERTRLLDKDENERLKAMLQFVTPYQRQLAVNLLLDSRDFWQTSHSIINCSLDHCGCIDNYIKIHSVKEKNLTL